MSEHDHTHTPPAVPPAPGAPQEDAGSIALAGALRSSFLIVQFIMVLSVILFLGSGIFVVNPQQRALLLRFGSPIGQGEHALLNPGIHWAFPSPIDEVVKIPYTALQTADSSVGWYQSADDRRKNAPKPYAAPQLDPAATSYAISADTNIVHVFATVRYRITDPVRYYFDFTNAAVFVTNALNNSLIFAASQFPVDDILTKNRSGFREAVTQRLKNLLDEEHLGITIESQLGVDVSPPLALAERFDAVDAANVQRDKARSEAESYATRTLATARGTYSTPVYAADSEKARVVSMVDAEAKKFNDVRAEWERAPEFYQRLRQTMVIERIFNNVHDKIIEPHLNPRELRLNLSREPQAPPTNSVTP